MTNDNRFDAALRAQVSHRPFLEGEEGGAQPAAPPAGEANAELRSPNLASELEATLMRDLNSLTAGLRPRKLLPERASVPAPAVHAAPPTAVAKPQSRYAPPSRLPPATGPQTAEAAPTISPYAPPPKLPRATLPAATAKVPPGEAKQADEKAPSAYAPQAKRSDPAPAPAPLPVAAGQPKRADPAPAIAPAKPVSRYAPPKRPAYPGAIPRKTGVSAGSLPPTVPEVSEQPAVTDPVPDPEPSSVTVDVAEAIAAIALDKAVPRSIVALSNNEAEAESESFDGPTVNELARLYAPGPPGAASVAPDLMPEPRTTATSDSRYAPRRVGKRVTAAPETVDTSPSEGGPPPARHTAVTPRAADGSKPRPIRWQARDEGPAGSLRPRRGGSWTSKAAVALVVVGLIGGAGAVVTFESRTPAERGPGLTAADRTHSDAAPAEAAAAGENPPASNLTVAARVAVRGVEVVHADDASNGLAPAEGAPLPSSAKVIPLPQPVQAGAGFRPTRDPASGGDAGNLSATETSGADAAPAAAVALGGGEAASDEPATDGLDVTADGGDVPAGPAPRAPTPRPQHDGAAAGGVLAYAPTADPVDRGARAFASEGEDKTAAKAPKSGSARVVSWVNMRAGADNNAATVKVLPAGSVVTVVKCSYWCEIVADGKRGFVFKSFLKSTAAMASGQ